MIDTTRAPGRLALWLDRRTTVLLVLPGVLLLGVVIAYPVGFNIWNSFTNRNLSFPITDWVGLGNYRAVLSDPAFFGAIGKTLLWTFGSVAGQLLVGFAGAVALQNIRRGQTPLRLGLIIPWAFPSIALAFSWKFLLDPLYGVLNDVLIGLRLIDAPVAWLGQSGTAMPSLIAMNVWFGFPFMMVALLAGLQTIPVERFESARMDGATYWQELRYITVPALSRLIGALVVLRTIWVFNNFDFVYLTTAGGPNEATLTLPVYAFQVGWANYDIGRMAAVCVCMLALLMLIIAGYLRLVRVDEEES
ncbi:carbohydrate ABC transporter permease [Micromonospora echinospora]|uniref:carbohydrate ABC transporter permease n=1 Tax=Micromonospora echinospora TaxID=1877 RepID=UPI0037AC6D10